MSPSRENILVVDDEPGMCRLLREVLGDAGYRVTAHQNPHDALKAFERERFDLVISDVRMPKLTGVDVLRSVKTRAPATPVILVTAYGSTKTAVEAMKLGTSDFITKPFRNEEIRLVVESVLDRRRLAAENAALRRELAARDGFGPMVGVCAEMKEAFRILAAAAESDLPLAIFGGPGTGKSLAARSVHLEGARSSRAFVELDCAGVPESEADARVLDRLAAAEGGTLFVRNADVLAASGQSALLRFLHAAEPGVRVIASLADSVEKSRLRPELLRKLSALTAILPPLSRRRDDLPALVAHLLERAAERMGRSAPAIGGETLDRLAGREWTGGVRELERCLERACALGRFDAPAAEPGGELEPFRDAKQAVVERFERAYLEKLLEQAEGSVTRAAAIADMDRKNLYDLLRKHGLGPRG